MAAVYDKMGHDRFSIKMAEYTLDALKKLGAEPIDGLDLCCGTGSAIRTFSESGLSMSGLDGSRGMLKVAREKLAHSRVKLYHQRLPRFEIKVKGPGGKKTLRRFDLVTSFFDSLNYLLTPRDLTATYRSVYRHLKPGGYFIFDMNTPLMLRTVGTDQRPFAGANNQVAWIFQNDVENKGEFANLNLTFFAKEGRHWTRIDEHHRQRSYPNSQIKKMLRSVGFQIKGFHNCFTFDKATAQSRKIAVIARRP
jgi:ubiquinone/menaquinone biosynthesis C-methylase UbiE